MTTIFRHRAARGVFVGMVILFFVVCGVHLTGMHHDGGLYGVTFAVYSSLLVLVLVGDLALFEALRRTQTGSDQPLPRQRHKRRLATLFAATPQPLRC